MIRFLKKQKQTTIYSPVTGRVHPMSEAQDDVFRSGMMGEGCFFKPNSNLLYSPVSGTVMTIFPTKHAIVIRSKDNIDILIHIGTDTVELGGRPFTLHVTEGDQVTPQTELATVDFDRIRQAGKGDDVYILFPELEDSKVFHLEHRGEVTSQESIGSIT